jgi:F-type H+-transporting ATPase subunit epsilon
MAMHLRIVTPEASIYDDQVDDVLLPGVEGEMGILSNHSALMTQIKPGELRIKKGGQVIPLAVGDGFVEVTGDSVSVLTDLAVKESDIDEQKVQEAVRRAEEALRAKTLVGEELEATQAALARSLAQLHVKRRRHG